MMRVFLLLGLLALRLPSIAQPAGGDQGLFAYEGQRVLAGDALYRDVWDQKPPGIAFVYAALLGIWPHESVVAAADLSAAALVAFLLVMLGRRRFTPNIGYGAAALFLLFGDPYLQRLSGLYVRGQCEPFIALAVTATLTLLAASTRSRTRLLLAGVALAAAFWLKYNAVTYALPVVAAVWAWGSDAERTRRHMWHDLLWIALGGAIVTLAVVIYLAVNGVLYDFRLATLDYNLRYSNETYTSPASMLAYPFLMPIERARVEMLWFLGALGCLLLIASRFLIANRFQISDSRFQIILVWVVAAILSIVVNGQRDLPNYFVQANPALALAASAGIATLLARPLWVRYGVIALFIAGIWRVGADPPVAGLRWAGLPGLIDNIRFDLGYARGRIDRASYLARFRGRKHDALEIDQLVQHVKATTRMEEPIYVFGFSGGSVCWKSDRVSSSRFFWSRPVLIEFAADRPGYGSRGLLDDLRRRPPALVALQKEQWQSHAFFMNNDGLRAWLEEAYVPERETPMFAVWRRKS